MRPEIVQIWVYLSASPLTWLTATLCAYWIGDAVSARFSRHALANPVVIAAALLSALLVATGTGYRSFFDGAQFVHFLLGPATVALAIPLYRNLATVRRALLPMAAALVAGSVTAAVSAVGIAWLFGAPHEVLASLAPKSVTAPIAMELAKSLGGVPSLTAVLVVATGITGAVVVTPLMNALKIRDRIALVERRRHLDERVRIKAVEAGSERQRIGADMADLDPVAGVDRLRQPERPRQDIDGIAGRAADLERHDVGSRRCAWRIAGSGMKRAGSVILPVHESDSDAQMPSLM
jgi:putative effector of murein hydrolase